MNIRPSAAIRQNYNEIADMCRKTAEPIFLTKNGEGDLVVMDIETYNRREKMLKLREELLAVEEDRIAGRNGCTLDELDAYLDDVIAEVKRDLGLPMYDAPNAVEELKQPRKHPTAEKVEAIKDALKHFEII